MEKGPLYSNAVFCACSMPESQRNGWPTEVSKESEKKNYGRNRFGWLSQQKQYCISFFLQTRASKKQRQCFTDIIFPQRHGGEIVREKSK